MVSWTEPGIVPEYSEAWPKKSGHPLPYPPKINHRGERASTTRKALVLHAQNKV